MINSKSTDKLSIVMDALGSIINNPEVQTVTYKVRWETLIIQDGNGGCDESLPVPVVDLEVIKFNK